MHGDRPVPLAPGTPTPPVDWSHTRATPTGVPPPPTRLRPPRPRRWHDDRGRLELAAHGRPALDAVWRVGSGETRRGFPRHRAAQWPPRPDGRPTPSQSAFSRARAGCEPQSAPAPWPPEREAPPRPLAPAALSVPPSAARSNSPPCRPPAGSWLRDTPSPRRSTPVALWPLPHDRAEDVFTTPERLQGRVELALGPLHLRQRAQGKILRGSHPGSRLTRRHCAVPHLEQPAPTYTRLPPCHTGEREPVIRPFPRHHIGGQRHPQGVQHRLHHFDLRQVGAIILAVTALEEPVVASRGRHTGAGAIDMHPLGGEVIHPHRVLMQGRCKGAPPCVITQASQHDFESVIGEIDACDRLAGRGPKRPKPRGHPGCHMHHAVVTPGHNGTEPDRAHPAQAATGPVAVGGKMGG